jgi:chaperonin GroEL (HSP60 family)
MRRIYDNLSLKNTSKFEDGGALIEHIKNLNKPTSGFDAKNHTVSLDLMREAGVVDPVKVVKSALRYGAGLASILLTADCAVVEENYNFAKRVHE